MTRTLILAALAAVSLAAPGVARKPVPAPVEPGKETSIPFISYRAIEDFEADGDRGVWLQDRSRHWYYARISGICTGLPFATRIGVDTRFSGNRLDRTGSLLVDGDRCRLDSLTTSAGPPPKARKSKKG